MRRVEGDDDLADPKDISPGASSVGHNLFSVGSAASPRIGDEPKMARETSMLPKGLGVDNSLNPGLSLDRIGQALAAFYDDLVAEGVPEHLAALVRQVKPSSAEESAPDAPSCTPILHKSGRLALIVEDDATTRALAESLFEPTDLDAVGCDSAEAALDILRERGADVALVFADVRLAGAMDGLQLARAVSTLWPRARMVVTSGRPIERPGDLPGEAVFIPKPWSPRDVLVEAERAIEPKPILP